MNSTTPDSATSSPCIGVCALDDNGYCIGCWRSMDEISRWLSLSEQQRSVLVDTILPQRQQAYFNG